jgi:predicted transposase YdaD
MISNLRKLIAPRRFSFINWIVILPEELKQSFWSELRTYEEERRMPYITSVEEIGFERGIQQGGERERSLVLRQLTRRVSTLPQPIQAQVEALPLEQLESLGEALLDFSSLSDLETWLANLSE